PPAASWLLWGLPAVALVAVVGQAAGEPGLAVALLGGLLGRWPCWPPPATGSCGCWRGWAGVAAAPGATAWPTSSAGRGPA
ncbi:MAG: hypothetical protein ACLFTX_08725, partial [Thiohalospira sp.]